MMDYKTKVEIDNWRAEIHESEQAVIGAILIEPDLYSKAAEIVSAEDFGFEYHRTIYKAIGKIYGETGMIDMIGLLEEINSSGAVKRDDTREYLIKLVDFVPNTGNIEYYCGFVKKSSVARKAKGILSESIFDGFTGVDTYEAIQETVEKLSALIRDKGRAKMQTINEVLQEIYQDVFVESEDMSLKTGFNTLDKLLDGIYPADLVTIGAGTGVGKTAFALQIIANMAKKGKKIVLYSQEMTAKQNVQRIISRLAGIEMKKLRRADRTTEAEKKEILKAFDITHKYLVNISAEGGLRVSDIRLDCVSQSAKDADVIFIDHVGLMRGEKGTYQKRDDELTQIMTGLRSLALHIEKPIIVLAQFNREAKPETTKKGTVKEIEPQLHHFKGSSEIEQSSSTVIFLWRMPDYDTTGTIGIKVAKNRQSENGKFYVTFDAKRMNFLETIDYTPPTGFVPAGDNDLEEMFFQ